MKKILKNLLKAFVSATIAYLFLLLISSLTSYTVVAYIVYVLALLYLSEIVDKILGFKYD